MRKRPFRTAWKTEIFEIVKTNTKPIEVSFLGNLLNSLSVLVNDPVNESNSVGSFMVILISSRINIQHSHGSGAPNEDIVQNHLTYHF